MQSPPSSATVTRNVYGEPLIPCSLDPVTGYYRTGCCETDATDTGMHLVCAVMTDEFLEFSRECGNDLSTPHPEWGFPGLIAGDQWCLCLPRWLEALDADRAPRLKLKATHADTLHHVSMHVLQKYAVDPRTRKALIWVTADQGDARRVLLLHLIPERGAFEQPVTGSIAATESLFDGAARELLEETGFDSQRLEPLKLKQVFQSRWGEMEEHAFHLNLSAATHDALLVRLDRKEHDSFRWVDVSEARLVAQKFPFWAQTLEAAFTQI